MRSELTRIGSPRSIALAILVLSCGARGTSVHCSPTPSCSLAPERFEPPPTSQDAGPSSCDTDAGSCPAKHIAAGRAHTCALSPSGELLCWGDGSQSQLGGSTYPGDELDAGMLRFALDGVRAIAAGDAHSCAVDADGAVWCWGRNAEGQIDGSPSDAVERPVVVPGVVATAVTAGAAHSCALVAEGVSCWGSAKDGQVGREVGDHALEPGLVPGTSDAVEVSAGSRHTCARLASGRVTCWGELFDGDGGAMRARAEPAEVPTLDDAEDVAAGAGFTCALRRAGTVVCWGDNGSGQLGNGTTEASATPVEVVGLEIALSVEAGGAELDGALVGHACAVNKSFFVQCWGRNHEGQLAQAAAEDIPRAVTVRGEEGDEADEPFLPDVTAIAVGGFHTCSIDHDGPVLCWGDNRAGQLGASEPAPFGHPVEARPFSAEY